MKRFIPILVIALLGFSHTAFSQNDDVEFFECVDKAKSCLNYDQGVNTFPGPFEELRIGVDPDGEDIGLRWFHYEPAVSTGYYFVTNQSSAGAFWRPRPDAYFDPDPPGGPDSRWNTVSAGHRLRNPEFWDSEDNDEGYAFFRNPAGGPYLFDANGDELTKEEGDLIDTTYDAIAGPIPINLAGAFRFNDIRYDSFYVSTNGIVGFSNRRYRYNSSGNRVIDPATGDCYDRQSMDWYVGGQRSRTNESSTLSLQDPTPDNYGHYFMALGGNPGARTAGLRGTGGILSSIPNKAPVVAPFYGDLHLSQYNAEEEFIDPFGKVMYRRSINGDKLYITFINIAIQGGRAPGAGALKGTQCGNYSQPSDLRPSNASYIGATAQVILDLEADAIEVVYRNFDGTIAFGAACQAPSASIFRYNTTAGVRGFARHENWGRSPANQDNTVEYQQQTIYWTNIGSFNNNYDLRRGLPWPNTTNQVIRYKQWQNTLRVVDIQYLVRDYRIDPVFNDLSFTIKVEDANNYELLAGEQRLGAIQPKALIQNLSNNIQGFGNRNYLEQDLEFNARFRIFNQASGRLNYGKVTPIDDLCLGLVEEERFECTGDPSVKIRLASVIRNNNGSYSVTEYVPTEEDPDAFFNYPGDGSDSPSGDPFEGIPPYGFVEISFPPFEPDEFNNDNIGRLKAFVIAVPKDPQNRSLGDEWGFDDTTSVNLFVMRRLTEFYDDATEFHLIDGIAMPSVWKWVNINAQIVNGEAVSKHPLPPRGRFGAQFVEEPISERWVRENLEAAKAYSEQSPVIKINRKTLGNAEPVPPGPANYGGDELRSFPIDMRGKQNAVLSVSVQRVEYDEDWSRGFGDGTMIGPEPRVIFNGNDLTQFDNQSGARFRNASAYPDAILVELLNNYVEDPLDRLQYVTNVEDDQWRLHFRRGGADEEDDVPALRLFGGGGYQIGFLETDADSSLAPPANGLYNSLRPNRWDDGIDEEYSKFFIAIPDTFINFPHSVAQNFRFRIKAETSNDQKAYPGAIGDDDDDFFVDNVRILFDESEQTDIEASTVKTKWPYKTVPATQAAKVPVKVVLTNNTANGAPVYSVKVKIYQGDDPDAVDGPIYCRSKIIQVHNPRLQIRVDMPTFNARAAGPGEYTMEAIALVPNGDRDVRNDTTFYTFNLEFGDDFAYDPVVQPDADVANNVPNANLGRAPGRGINFFGYTRGGFGTPGRPQAYNNNVWAAGDVGASGTGEIAMRFTLENADTVYGYKAAFGDLNRANDQIQFSIWESTDEGPGARPSQQIPNSIYNTSRGVSDTEIDENTGEKRSDVWNRYCDYRLANPVVLQPGSYWISIVQLGQTGLELGASGHRAGMRTTNVYYLPPNEPGVNGIQLSVHDDYRYRAGETSNFEILTNDNLFAYRNSAQGGWSPMMQTVGNPGLAHLHHYGTSPVDGTTLTLTRGFWVPFLRPYLGEKAYGENPEFQECADDLAVEMTDLVGNAVNGTNQLWWETIQENNNKGFYIERKLTDNDEYAWESIDFVNGLGAGLHEGTQYTFVDEMIQNNTSYDYRVKTVDIENIHNCKTSNIVTIENGNSSSDLVVRRFTTDAKTTFNIELPNEDNLLVEITDMYGNTVNTLYNNRASQGPLSQLIWDNDNLSGSKVSQGTYIYRIQTSDDVVTGKINIVNN